MRKKSAILFALLSALGLILSGCAFEAKPQESVQGFEESPFYSWGTVSGRTITVWGRSEDLNRSYILRGFQRYEELTGNTVSAQGFTSDRLEQEVYDALQTKRDGPDVLLSFGGVNIDSFDPEKNFYDFSDARWVDDLTDTSINQAVYHGKVIGLPYWEVSISGTLYNKTIFKELGISVPQNQEEFMQACRILLENGITPLYLPCGSPTMMLYQFPMDAVMEKGDTLDSLNSGRTRYSDIPEMRDIIEWYRTMAQDGFLGERYMENDWDGMSPALSSGEYAMMLCWDTWLYTDFQGDPAQFGLMPAFVGYPEEGTFEGPNLSLLMVNKNGSQVDAALDLITFMADPYNYNEAFEEIYTAPVFKHQVNSISTPQYAEASRWIEENYRDSTAWLRVQGFSQSDSSCILKYMSGTDGYTAEMCLEEMDRLRLSRLADRQG